MAKPSEFGCAGPLLMTLIFLALNFYWSGGVVSNAVAAEPSPSGSGGRFTGRFDVVALVSGLDTPWDLSWGPDGAIWFTERKGTVSRLDLVTGKTSLVGRMDVREVSESGLMGMAFHPDFALHPFVYLVYSYEWGDGIGNRLARWRYDGSGLRNEEILQDGIPGAPNHNGSRLAVGKDRLLYMTTGDTQRSSLAEDRASLAGKVLRFTLDGRWAPDNPYRNPVYSYGHRNPQGIVFHPVTGALYITEHGPSDNDEVNRVVKGGNFGWPNVHGYCDGDVRGEKAYCETHRVVEPMAVWTPTVAPAGVDFYGADLVPGWKGSLLFTTLKGQALYRLVLSSDGKRVTGQESYLKGQFGRLRDVLVGHGGEIYLATSNRDGRAWPGAGDDRILRLKPRLTD
ncbi:MAG TPA: PQQ-dependent sugar dehydrogenase [Candidatus Binatia bacterium]